MTEDDRVLAAVAALESSDLPALGQLFNVAEQGAEHASAPCLRQYVHALDPPEVAVAPLAPLDGEHQRGDDAAAGREQRPQRFEQALLLARLASGLGGASLSNAEAPALMTARQALELGTRGSASVLGRSDLGSLEVGKCADFFAIDLNRLDYAGALHDPVAAAVFCHPVRADFTFVGGKPVVKDGRLATVDEGAQTLKVNLANLASWRTGKPVEIT